MGQWDAHSPCAGVFCKVLSDSKAGIDCGPNGDGRPVDGIGYSAFALVLPKRMSFNGSHCSLTQRRQLKRSPGGLTDTRVWGNPMFMGFKSRSTSASAATSTQNVLEMPRIDLVGLAHCVVSGRLPSLAHAPMLS